MNSLLSLLVLGLAVGASAAERPNVVFILCDDLGINDLACYGRAEHRTPHIDSLAKDGLRCTQSYASCPVCSPTRAAILTGKHPARLHLTTFLPGRADAPSQKLLHPKILPQLPREEVTLAERFHAAGYATACLGKWHLGNAGFGAKEQGFDTVFPGKANTTPGPDDGGKGEFDLTAKAVEFIDANAQKPFFLYLAHHTPHIPLGARKDLREKYHTAYNPTYAAMIHSLDECVGLVLAALDRKGLAKKTIVVFTSDNGGVHVPELKDDAPTHNTPYRAGKGFLYEGGLRVPAIVRYTGTIPAESLAAAPIVSTDWAPTLLSFCNIPTTDTFDGIDQRSALMTGAKLPERTLYWHFPHYSNQGSRPSGAVLEGMWKYIEHYEDGRSELFNLTIDRGETIETATRNPAIAREMKGKLHAWLQDVNAQMNAPNPQFNAAMYAPLYDKVDVSKLKIEATAALTSAPLREWRKAIDAAVKAK